MRRIVIRHFRPMSVSEERRKAIQRILESVEVSSQAELLEHLGQEGFQTTQPVLSRDLRALKVAKRGGIYQLLTQEKITPLEALGSLLRDVEEVGPHLVVVRCEPGAASAIARGLESERVPDMVGTVAGDDTVFIAIRTLEAGQSICERVRALI